MRRLHVMRGLFKAAAWLLLLSAVSVCGLRRGVQRREQLTVSRAGPLGVRLSKELRVLEVLDSGSPLLVEDRITAVNGVSVADDELHEFKDKLDQVQVPYVLSVDRLVLDQQNEAEKREAKLFMDSNDHPDILSSSLKAREVELRLHLPVVSVKRAQALEVQNFVSEAAEFSGPFSCDYRRLLVATPEDGCHVEAKDKKKQMYKDSIVIVKRGVCSFFTKALNAQEAGAMGVIIVNTEDKIFPIKDPQASKSLASVVMVSKSSGKEIMELVGAVGSKLSKNIHHTLRIAPPNACLGARQRESQHMDEAYVPTLQQGNYIIILSAADGRMMVNEAALSPVDPALAAIVDFNEKKEQERKEKLEHEEATVWIKKSTQGSHGFESNVAKWKNVENSEYVLSETDRISSPSEMSSDFGYLLFGGTESGGTKLKLDYMTLHGEFDMRCRDKIFITYSRLPYTNKAKDGSNITLNKSLIKYYDRFQEQINSLHDLADGSSCRALAIDFSPIANWELNANEDGDSNQVHITEPDIHEALAHLRSLPVFNQGENLSCFGVFFLSFAEDTLSSQEGFELNEEYYNWSFPIMKELKQAIIVNNNHKVDARTSSAIIPIAVIPTLKSFEVRNFFHGRDLETYTGSISSSRILQEKWVDMWRTVDEIGSVPDVRLRKKIYNMMKNKYEDDDDALLYLSRSLLSDLPSMTAYHNLINKKSVARTNAASMRGGGYALRLQKEIDSKRKKASVAHRKRAATAKVKRSVEGTERYMNGPELGRSKPLRHQHMEL